MRPMFFESAEELIKFIDRLPTPYGQAKGYDGELVDAQSALTQLKALVPGIFRYREVLVKAPGGLGNLKSVRRFSDVASTFVSNECHEVYENSLNELAEEIENLINFGASEETARLLSKAKTQIAVLTLTKDSILGFKAKLQKQMERVEDAANGMISAVNKAVKSNRDFTIKDQLGQVVQKLQSDLEEIKDLMEMMDKYCALQVTYHAIMIGAMGSAA